MVEAPTGSANRAALSSGLILRVLNLQNGKKAKNKSKKLPGIEAPQYFTMFMAELIGTGLMLFLGCMGCIPDVDNPPAVHHMSSLSFGLVILLIIQAFGHISGAHLNPSVTIAAVLCKITTPVMGIVYVVAQFIGAFSGFALLRILIPVSLAKPGLCLTLPHPLMTSLQTLAIETIITAVLIIIICAVWDKRNAHNSDSLPLRFGFIIVAISMVAGPFSGASMNTARTFAPAVLAGNYKDQWVYWVGPNLGAVLGVGVYKYLFALKEKEIDNEETYHLQDVSHNVQAKA